MPGLAVGSDSDKIRDLIRTRMRGTRANGYPSATVPM
jgi:hypothetical protein